MARILLLPTLLLASLFLLGFLISAPSARTTDTITFINQADIHTLDPHSMSWSQDIRVAMALWEGLCTYDPKTLKPIPGMAESWDFNPATLTYTFHLRSNARWSNGDPLTASDFRNSWRRGMDPKYSEEYIALFYYIKGAKAYADALAANKPADFSTVGVTAPDPHTLVVTLGTPCTFFLDLVAFPTFYPLNLPSMAPFADDPTSDRPEYTPKWTHPPNLITNGPYFLADWKFKQYLLLKPNPAYWDRVNVQCPNLKIVAFESASAAILAYQNGQADAMSYIPPEFGRRLLAQQNAGRRHDVHYEPVFGTYYYIFNCRKKPFDDPRVRKAFALVIDKEKIVTDVTKMHQKPANVIVPSGYIAGYESPAGLAMNIPLAQKLLADAGYPNGADMPPIEFVYNNAPPHKDVAEAIRQMWEQNLGVHISLKPLETKAFSTARRKSEFSIARAGWYGDYMDPTTWLDLARTSNANNDGKFSNPAFDALMAKSDDERDPAKRFALLNQAENMLTTQEFPFIAIYQYADAYIFDPAKVAGLEMNVRMLTQLKWIHRPQRDAENRGADALTGPPTRGAGALTGPLPNAEAP